MAETKNELRVNLKLGTFKIPKEIVISLNGLSFLNACLRYHEMDRITFEELINHPYFVEDESLNIKTKHNRSVMRKIRLKL